MNSWPHAPARLWVSHGSYLITAGTYQKKHLFDTPEKLRMLQEILFEHCQKHTFMLQSWALMANHYHIIGHSEGEKDTFKAMLGAVHGKSAIELNKIDETPGRKVWFQYWDTRITYEKSYLARLAYVHQNPAKHGLVRDSVDYEFCSASWFKRTADQPWYDTIMSFDTSQVNVFDDF